MPQFSYNPQQHQFTTPMERMPRGWYPAIIEASDILPTNNKDGFRLELTFRIIDGPGKGKKVKEWYNIDNPNPKTVEYAMNDIKTINACIGNFQPIQQSEEMHNKPLQILLTEPKDSDFNSVKGYKDINGVDADKIAAAPPMGHQQQPAQGFGQPPAQQPYGAPPAYAQNNLTQAPPQYQQAPPAYAPQPPQYQQAPPQYQQAPPQYQQEPPAWTPGGPAPSAPAWAPPR